MQLVATKPDGGRLLEVSEREYYELVRLQQVVDGKVSDELGFRHQQDFRTDFDFGGVWGAIRAFYLARFRVNEMKGMVVSLEEVCPKGE